MVKKNLCCSSACHADMNSHPHLRGEGGQRREGPAGQDDAANLLPDQVLHAEARTEAPVAEDVAWKEEGNIRGNSQRGEQSTAR